MKKFQKIIAILIVSLMAFVPVTAVLVAPEATPTAEAASPLLERLLGILGLDMEDLKNMSQEEILQKVKEALEISNIFPEGSPIGGILQGIMREIQDYLGGWETPTKEETTTEAETTTEEPTTERPVTPPTPPSPPPYNGGGTYVPPPTVTQAPETTTFPYVPPEQVWQDVYTTVPFTPQVEDDEEEVKESSPFKTILGIILLVGSGVAVIVVAVKVLKKSNI